MPHYNDWTSAFHPKAQLGKERAGFTPVANRNGTATVTTTDGGDSLTEPSDALMETTNFDDRGHSPISGEGVFKPQDIDTKGSVIFGDNHFTTGGGGDSITGDGRPMNVWTNGSATSFEDRRSQDFDSNDMVFGYGIDPVIQRQTHPNDNITGTAGPSGSIYRTAKTANKMNAYVYEDVDGFMKLSDIKSELQTTDLRSGNRFVIERFEPGSGMDSFGKSLNPVLEFCGSSGPGGSTFMTGEFEMPTDNVSGTGGPGGSPF